MDQLVFELLMAKKLLDEKDDLIADNQIQINGNEVIIQGNKRGLILLADYLVQVAINNTAKHHVHLDLNNFFDKANCELIIVKE